MWGCAILIVHHTGHAEKQRARGSMALKGALDSEYKVQINDTKQLTLSNTKMKDSDTPKDKFFQIISVPISLNIADTSIQAAALEAVEYSTAKNDVRIQLTPNERRGRDIFLNCLIDRQMIRQVRKGMPKVDCVRLDDFRECLREENITSSDKEDSIKKAISRAIDGLINKGIAVTYGDYIWLADKTDKTRPTEI
jgi:hypothetical protein